MGQAIAPRSLRSVATVNLVNETFENYSGRKVSAVAGLIAVASFSGAEAQQSNLPPVTVDAPVERPRPAASKPTPDQIRARNALRRAARRTQPAQVAAVPFPNAGGLQADRNPYADAAAPYKVDHVQASGKFPGAAVEHAEDRHGAEQGGPGGQERHHAEAGDPEHRRRDARNRRGRQRLRRPLLHSRLRRPQRHLPRRRARCRRQRSREFLHRAGRNPARTGFVVCRPRHHRRRHQHRLQAGDGGKELLQHGHHVRHRPHQARHARRQPGDQSDAGGARGRIVPGRRRCRPRLYQGRSQWRLRRREMDAARHGQAHRGLHSHRTARIAGFRRSVLPAEHGLNRRRSVPGFRRQPQQFLRLRQSRLLPGRAGHRDHQRRGPDHAGPDPERQGQGFALDAELYRHDSGIAGARQSTFGVDAQCQSAEPLSGHRRRRQPDRGNLQVRHRRLEAHRAGRRRGLARNGQHRQIYRA